MLHHFLHVFLDLVSVLLVLAKILLSMSFAMAKVFNATRAASFGLDPLSTSYLLSLIREVAIDLTGSLDLRIKLHY